MKKYIVLFLEVMVMVTQTKTTDLLEVVDNSKLLIGLPQTPKECFLFFSFKVRRKLDFWKYLRDEAAGELAVQRSASSFFEPWILEEAFSFTSFIHVCHRDDPNINNCLITAVEDLRPYLVTGVPDYNIPSLEPLIMHDLISENVAGMAIDTSNVSAYGCSEFFVRNISMTIEDKLIKVVLDIDIPKLRIEAHYAIDGKILVLPIKGNGNLEANVTDCVSRTYLTGQLYEKNGETYLKYTEANLKFKIGGGRVRLENMFNNDKILLGVVNDVINKNFDAFMTEFKPVLEKQLSMTFIEIGNRIVEPFTYKQLFPH